MQLSLGSQWFDTQSGEAPQRVLSRGFGDGPYRRIVTLTEEPEYLMVRLIAAWQQWQGGQWVTLVERRGGAAAASFGKTHRFRPLHETDGS